MKAQGAGMTLRCRLFGHKWGAFTLSCLRKGCLATYVPWVQHPIEAECSVCGGDKFACGHSGRSAKVDKENGGKE